MDAALLRDPGFWGDGASVAMGGIAGGLPAEVDGLGLVFFQTSGSGGVPKWIGLRKEALLLSAAVVNRHLRVDENACWGLALPLHHVGGFGVAARAFEAGCRLREFSRRWDAAAFRDWVAAAGVTHTSLVPTQVHDLVRAGLRGPAGLLAVVVGGGHLSEEEGRAARALGWPVLASYGMTEAGSQIATQGMELLEMPYVSAPLTVLPHWRVEVSEEGLLRIAGPALFDGWLEPDGDGWQWRRRAGEWHETSDRAEISAAGLTPLGRADGVVKILGELVDPEAVERELAGDGLTLGEFCVVAVPDARAGHRLVAVAESADGVEVLRERLEHYHRDAPGFRRVDGPVRMDPLPRSALGKLLRGEIVRNYGLSSGGDAY
jgi:O-succinylbenzoic acid--CoA ligase